MAATITIEGENLIALKAQNNEALNIDTFIFANVPGQDADAEIDRNETVPALAQQVHTQEVQQNGRINNNVVIYSTVLNSTTGPFEFNWVGLYSSESDTLIGINHIPTTAKTATGGGTTGNTLNQNFSIQYSGIADITGVVVDPETWQLDFTARLTGIDELNRKLGLELLGDNAFIDEGFKVEPRATENTFNVLAGAGYISGHRVELETAQVVTASSYPKNIFVDAYFQGDASSTWAAENDVIITSDELTNYVDSQGIQHYLLKIAIVTAADQVEDLREDFNFIQISAIRNFKTISEAKNDKWLRVGQKIVIEERNNSKFNVVNSASVNINNIDAIASVYNNEIAFYLNNSDGDIRNYGGKDDYLYGNDEGTDNKLIIDFLYSKKPIKIKLPKTENGTGVYFYDGYTTETDATGIEIIADEGVSIANKNGRSPLWIKGLKINREVESYRIDAKYKTYIGPNSYTKLSEKSRMASASVGQIFTPKKIDLSQARNFTLSLWPNGNLTSANPASSSDISINWGVAPASNFYLSSVPVVVGDHITAHMTDTLDRCAAFIETDNGWLIINSASDSGVMQVTEKSGAANSVQYDFTESVLSQKSYSFNRAALGLIIYGTKSFGITVNGILLRRIDTQDAIVSAGWGAGFESGGASLSISRASYFKNKKTVGVKPLKIVGVGDSTSDDALPPSQYQYMSQYLGGAIGAQVLELNNIAVAGQTSTQQLSILQSTDISGFDYCLIQIGVNDIQTGFPSLSYAANIESMLDYCDANHVTPIVGLPTGWYSQADAQAYGQDGQATNDTNTNVGPYRAALMQVLADRGNVLMNPSSVEDQGAIIASLLGTDLDPMVGDNIHPTALNQMCSGYSYAKAIIGHATGIDSKGGEVKSPKNWWAGTLGTTTTPQYTTSKDKIFWSWFLSTDGVTISDGDIVGTIPERLRPESSLYINAINATLTSYVPTANPNAVLHIGTDGNIRAYSIDPAAIYVSFNTSYNLSN